MPVLSARQAMPAAEVPPLPPPGARGRICVVTVDTEAPSYRYRIAPLLPLLQQRGWQCDVHLLQERLPGWRIWALRAALRGSGAVLLHKLRLRPWEAGWVRRLQPASWFDVDDAIWLRQPKWVGHQRPPAPRRAQSFDAMCANAAVTAVGNRVLAARAEAAGGRVLVVPTTLDVAGHPQRDPARPAGQVIVWIGLPANLRFLEPLRPVLAALARRWPGLRLRVISSQWPDWDDVPVERVSWSPDTERDALAGADIGIMPLSDDPYARGKCAFKLLQYMAAGLPCVASPVGANCEVVADGETGLLAAEPAHWESALQTLLAEPALRARMGRLGRARALQHYDAAAVLPAVADRLASLAGGHRPRPVAPAGAQDRPV